MSGTKRAPLPSILPDQMSRDGAIIFSDLIGKLDVLYVHCEKKFHGARTCPLYPQ